MPRKRPTGAKLRQGNIIRRRVGLLPLKPAHTRRGISLRTASKPKPKSKKGVPGPGTLLKNAAKIALRGIGRHYGIK